MHRAFSCRCFIGLQIYAAHKTQTPIVMKLGQVKSTVHNTWHPEEDWGIVNRLLDLVNVEVRPTCP